MIPVLHGNRRYGATGGNSMEKKKKGGRKNPAGVLNQGIDLYKQHKHDDALVFFLSLPADSGADSAEVAYYIGLCYTKLKRYEDAMLYLEQVVTSTDVPFERTMQCRFILALIYTLTGRKRLASYELEKLAEAKYKPAAVYAAMAYIAWEDSNVDACLDCYQKSLDADPNNTTAMNGLGYVLACEEKDLGKALSFCKKAVAASPDSAACLDSLGWVYYKMGIYAEAIKYLEMAEKIDKENELIAEHIRAVSLAGDAK